MHCVMYNIWQWCYNSFRWNVIMPDCDWCKLLLLNCSLDADVPDQLPAAPGTSCNGCHANPDAFIRHLCFDSFHAPRPASSFDDVISGRPGSGSGETGAGLERRGDANQQLQRLPLSDRQLGVLNNDTSRDQPEWRHSLAPPCCILL